MVGKGPGNQRAGNAIARLDSRALEKKKDARMLQFVRARQPLCSVEAACARHPVCKNACAHAWLVGWLVCRVQEACARQAACRVQASCASGESRVRSAVVETLPTPPPTSQPHVLTEHTEDNMTNRQPPRNQVCNQSATSQLPAREQHLHSGQPTHRLVVGQLQRHTTACSRCAQKCT